MLKSTYVLLLCALSVACGEVSGGPGDVNYLPSIPSNAIASPSLLIADFSAPVETIQPGGSYDFTVTLEQMGCTAVPAGEQLFVHFVSAERPDWFEFALYPVAAPPSETWGASTVIQGTAPIPRAAHGTYEVLIGINNGSGAGESQNIPLVYRAPVTETFGSGPIGFRYRVATILVGNAGQTNPTSPGGPNVPTSSFAQTVVDDMQKANDGELIFPGTRDAGVQMGLQPNGHQTPSYWQTASENVAATYENSGWWRTVTPWWNVLPVVGNTARHTRVEIGRGFTYFKTAEDGWHLLSESANGWVGEYDYYASHAIDTPIDRVPGSRAGNEAFLPSGNTNSLHGGHAGGQVETWRLTGLVSCVTARLVVDATTGIDDRGAARYIMWVGVDFYPDQSFSNKISWGPAAATSRRIRITDAWQLMCVAPLDKPGRTEPENYRAEPVYLPTTSLLADPPQLPSGYEGL